MNDLSPSQAHVALWARFDRGWYVARYPEDVARMAAEGIADAELFYRETGCRLGHSPNPYFAESWYLGMYRDVAEQVAAGMFASGFEHYLSIGFLDRSPHWLFSDRFYLAANTDVTRSRLDEAGFINGYDHYLAAGDAEFRSGHLFFNPGLLEAPPEGRRPAGPFAAFVAEGCIAGSQRRLSWYFDPVWYLQRYPEITAEIAAGLWSCALEHYLYNETPRRFDPTPCFSEEFYLSVHVDVIAAIEAGHFRNAYDHFIQFGVFECRRPHPDVDIAAYFRSIEVQSDIQNGACRDVFAHYVARGDKTQEPPRVAVSEHVSKSLFAARARSLRPLFARSRLDFATDGPPAVSVVMVMYNKLDLTLNALDSLRKCYHGAIELILVDSGSADESRHVERYVTGAKYVRFTHNVGFVLACNAAIKLIEAPATLFLNNDVLLEHNAVGAAIARLQGAADIGAVGGKIVRTNGVLQEAGCIIWRDGSTQGYLRDGDPNLPEANFVRDVDFCSGVFLLVRTDLLKELGGFDEIFKPAYFEETDFCIRIHEAGYRIVYDPAVMVVHQEYSSGDASIAGAMMAQNQPKFRRKNQEFLRTKYPSNPDLVTQARSPRNTGLKILFIEDRVPLRHLGSGFTRSNDIIGAMAALGHHVTVFPIYQAVENILDLYRDFPDTIELVYDRELKDLTGFIEERSGYFDVLWIARTHNAERLLDTLMSASRHLPINRIVLDTEAIAAVRDAARDAVRGKAAAESLDKAVQKELASAYFCQKIVAVNELDESIIRASGCKNVSVLGHVRELMPTPRDFEDRRDMLFLGAIHDQDSPNLDGLEWFIAQVLPILDELLPETVKISIAGYANRRIDMSPFGRARRVELLGPVEDLAGLYDRHRLFFAPTRFAAGIPFKLHEAASYGLPIVASEILCRQTGWTDGVELLSGRADDPAQFAARLVELYNDPVLWEQLRNGALARLAAENSAAFYARALSGVLAEGG